MVIFQQGEPDTMIARLSTAISDFDKEWAAKCVPAKEREIDRCMALTKQLAQSYGLKETWFSDQMNFLSCCLQLIRQEADHVVGRVTD